MHRRSAMFPLLTVHGYGPKALDADERLSQVGPDSVAETCPAQPGNATRGASLHTGRVGVSPRPSRRTNLALLVLLAGAFVTGWVAFGVAGSAESRVVAVVHGSLGIGLLVLAPWKTVIVRRGLRRRRGHALGVTFAVVVVVSLVTGLAHATLGPLEVAGITALQVHVGSAIAAVPLAVLHVVQRPQRPRATDLSRRGVVRAIGVGGAAALLYGALAALTS